MASSDLTPTPGRWVVDGNNVMGSRPDRWWNDRPAAQARLTQQIAEWCRRHTDTVTVVFDGRPVEAVAQLAGGNLRVEFATASGRNAADHRIVDLAGQLLAVVVVTADRGLRNRLPPTATVMGSRSFLALIAG